MRTVAPFRFDGAGTLTFPNGARFEATWRLGQLVTGMYYFEDELQYLPRNWQYCTDADRRFWSEQQFGIAFSQFPQLTDSGEQDTRSIPYGTYDMGDCYLNPKDNKLYNYDVRRTRGAGASDRRGGASGRVVLLLLLGCGALSLAFAVVTHSLTALYSRPPSICCVRSERPRDPGHVLPRSDAGGAHLGQAQGQTRTRQAGRGPELLQPVRAARDRLAMAGLRTLLQNCFSSLLVQHAYTSFANCNPTAPVVRSSNDACDHFGEQLQAARSPNLR